MISLFFPIFYRQGMFFPSDLLYAQSIFNTGNISNEPDSHRQLHRAQAQGAESDTGAAGAAARRVQQDHFKMGKRSFPNKRILETIHETPACVKGITIEYYIF